MWQGVSEEAKELVGLMTERDPEKRISAYSALCHRWFAKDFNHSAELNSALENMKKYSYEYSTWCELVEM